MSVGELKKALENVPDHLEVFMDERVTDFRYGLVNGVKMSHIDFYEDPDDEVPLSTDVLVVVLSEE